MIRTTALAVLFLAALGGPTRAGAGGPQWKLAVESPIVHRATVATFLDEQHGMTAGYAGAMYVTRDGGKTWTPATNSSACRFGLEARPGAAFTSGNQGHVRLSTDGGEHWTAVAGFGRTEPSHARFLSFADGKRGLIATPNEAALTLDAAATWTKLELPGKIAAIAAVSASEEGGALRLRLLDETGALFASGDGGKSWAEARSPLRGAVFESMTAPWAALRFNGGEGVLAAFVDEDGPRAHVYRTRDGGKSWTEEAVPAAMPAGAPSLSFDGKLLTTCDSKAVRVYRLN